ncbi:MAG: ferrous iron transport protein B [Caldisphaeraceae archaeon]|nr:ferrous iron transport protein B [Caldisphaeraceae archaeon]MEB3797463.1 ferrous iron transport protein B [Caldisphaeraceae archaeon]
MSSREGLRLVEKEYVVGLIALPNAGKTTLFNFLTGSRGYVANWPGKTVEVYTGFVERDGKKVKLIDLPGIQSLHTLSKEEELTKEFILSKKYDALVLLVNLESLYRSLYFALQVLEVTNKVIIAVSKLDTAASRGVKVDIKKLEELLKVPVVAISSLKNIGIDELISKTIAVAENKYKGKGKYKLNYGILEEYISKLMAMGEERGIAVRLIEGDPYLLDKINQDKRIKVEELRKGIKKRLGIDPEEHIARVRYEEVERIVKQSVNYTERLIRGKTFGEKFDDFILSNWVLGTLTLLSLTIAGLFVIFAINTGFPLNWVLDNVGLSNWATFIENYNLGGLISLGFSLLGNDLVKPLMLMLNAPTWSIDLVVNGVIAGISAVLSFVPLVYMINVFMAIVDDSGLMARSSVIFSKISRIAGVSGKAIFPMGISIGCNVPGVLATRILEDDKERYRVILALPFIICQARLIVMIFMLSAFIISPLLQTSSMLFFYLLSFVMFAIAARLVSTIKTYRSEGEELAVELPPYHSPSWKVVNWISWDRSKSFITKAGTVIFPASIVLWLITHIGMHGYTTIPAQSLGYILGSWVIKIFKPMGINDWQLGLALLSGVMAKEIVIESLAIAFSTDNPIVAIRALHLTIPQTLSILTFIMLYVPCIATLAVIYSETKNLKFVFLNLFTEISLALVASYVVYAALSFLPL